VLLGFFVKMRRWYTSVLSWLYSVFSPFLSAPRVAIPVNSPPRTPTEDDVRRISEIYFGTLGAFINHRERPEVGLFDFNTYIWTVRRELNEYLNRGPPPPPPPPPLSAPPPPPPPPPPLRRARRPTRPIADTPAQNDTERCKICMENKVMIICLPCGHAGLCNSCCKTVYGIHLKKRFTDGIIVTHRHHSAEGPHGCLFCKERVDDFKKMYLI
jgi:hypothetical protein